MSLIEISDMIVAMVEEEKRQDDMLNQRTSWAVSHIMNSSGNYKKPVKATDLYKPLAYKEQEEKENIVQRFESPEQKEDYLKNLMKKFGKDLPTDGSQ